MDLIIRNFLPDPIVVEAGKQASIHELTVSEKQWMRHFGNKRKEEFILGRALARRVLSYLGYSHHSLLPGPRGEPLWPDQIVGSITHAQGRAVVAVAKQASIHSIGIDLEYLGRLKPTVWSKVLTLKEYDWVMQQTADKRDAYASVFFAIKEAFYKYQYPLTRKQLGFLDVTIQIDPHHQRWVVKKSPQLNLPLPYEGSFLIHPPCVFASIYSKRVVSKIQD